VYPLAEFKEGIMASADPFGARGTLSGATSPVVYYRLQALADQGLTDLTRLPCTVKILLENVLRLCGTPFVDEDDVRALARWSPADFERREFSFLPARVLLQDLTGVPAVVDLAAMRDAAKRLGGDPQRINPLAPADLVIDHSVQVDRFGTMLAFDANVEQEYERNGERYALLRWAQQAFRNFRVVPPDNGICHQVNLEFLSSVVARRDVDGETVAMPDTLVGTDSHTTMVNGLGVLGWGVGGIEAEAVLLGQPLAMLTPEVIGFEMTGALREGVTATDLVLTVTEILRRHGVVEKFVEFCGAGLSRLSLPDRATLSNMAPEYGATAGLFPVDAETLRYLRETDRRDELVDLVERYTKEQGLFRTDATPTPQFNALITLDLSTVEPCLAGPRRPEDRVPLGRVPESFQTGFSEPLATRRGSGAGSSRRGGTAVAEPAVESEVTDGSVVIAAITSCTNTSNPSVMLGAGLVAKKAVERGLKVPAYVKTSLAPGSAVVTEYLEQAELLPYLDALGFNLVGYGCTTCIGNSGPLPPPVAQAVEKDDLVVAAVLSGNRNFEGRIHAQVRAAYLASPPLVVAYALAGNVGVNLERDPLGHDPSGEPVYLRDIWPTNEEVRETVRRAVDRSMFKRTYENIATGDKRWQELPVPAGELFAWDPDSTYVREVPFFQDLTLEPRPPQNIESARVLAYLGDAVSTDHISPAGAISPSSPAAKYLYQHEIDREDFNTYGARRGNHEVMMRGTFANIRLRNGLAQGKEGNWTTYLPNGELMSIYDAAMRYKQDGTPLIVIAGRLYGNGSSRDWAAKGTLLLGVRAVLVESFERIHRSNLVGMGVLPLQFRPGENAAAYGITGREEYSIDGIETLRPRQELTVRVRREDGSEFNVPVIARIDSATELEYYHNGGILQMVLRNLVRA
jgi:aconitate hydratase